MTDIASPLPDVQSGTRNLLPMKLALAFALAALADWLFWNQRIGLSMALFAVALLAGSYLSNVRLLERRRSVIAAAVLLIALLPAIEELNALSLLFVAVGLIIGVAVLTNPDFSRLSDTLRTCRDLFLIGPFRLIADVARMTSVRAISTGLTLWFVPLIFGAVFVFLFASANPLIEKGISLLDLREWMANFDLARTLFWALVLSLAWPFLHVRWRGRKQRAAPTVPAPVADNAEPSNLPNLFSADTILRSLILFNVLFAVQTMLDLAFLWGNARLPAGISYADYAHRGSYPLIVTALLAAAFVLAAMRPGGAAEKSDIIRRLVYLWVGQNVLLVISSMLRLDRYMEIYMLTGWRVAALVWMLLVVIGLILILARIILKQSNAWLVRMNLISLTVTLYMCSLVNFDAMIADYNVSHSKEASGKGVNLDTYYLSTLGPQALPALERARTLPGVNVVACSHNRLVSAQAADMASWRSWGFRSWRLQRYLDTHPEWPARAS